MPLTSPKNPLLQKIRRAASAGRPTEDGLIVAEGPHLLAEVLESEWRIEQLFATPTSRDRYADLVSAADAELIEVSERAFASIAGTETTQEVLALVRPKICSWHDLTTRNRIKNDLAGPNSLIVALDALQDPGNAGTIVRSAEAFGATGMILLKGTAHVANGKFLRASAGSIFRLPYLEGWSVQDLLIHAQSSGLQLFGLAQTAETDLTAADLRAPLALIVGSEGRGLSPDLANNVQQISIPTSQVESLNAAVACSIALFEAQRQRSASAPLQFAAASRHESL